jgi:tRNA pseudouridine38-40 synthase
MARYKVILAYDGTQYHGFQRQSHDHLGVQASTVQGVVESALRQIGWRERSIFAAGRTDAGVHASGQVVVFDFEWNHSPQELRAALDTKLPPDVSALSAERVNDDFHPRYDAKARHYRYHLYCQEARDPLRDRFAWKVWPSLDIETLNRAAAHLCGTHDFSAFGTPPKIGGSTVRSITVANWHTNFVAGVPSSGDHSDIYFEIVANAFLYRMVRRLVYMQVAIGQGRLEEKDLSEYLILPSKTVVQGLAPAQGLTLVGVEY